ncbi:MAG: ABC transporter permease subunit [candidate division Zixibacteria bacterium]|nr:ABC transporter permease subunit [candidate division Zixibacteria bacterium]
MVESRFGYLLIIPALLTIAVVAIYPIIDVFILSLYERFLTLGIDEFTGLNNYLKLVNDARFWNALKNTAVFTFFSVSLELILGMAVALFINRPFSLQGLIRAAVLLPWAVPTVVSAKIWAWIFNTDLGILNYALLNFGLIDADLNWLGSTGYAMAAAITVDVWKTTPFAALLLLAGLQVIPDDLYKAASVDGASRWQKFRHITIPHLKPVIMIVLLFRTLDAFRVFDAIYILTGGGPANSTETLSVYAYKILFQTLDFGYGSTIAVSVFAAVMLISIGYISILKRRGGLLS